MSSKGDNFEYVTKCSAVIIVLRKSTVIRRCCAEQCRMEETDSWRRNCENWGLTLEMTTSRAQVTWLSRSHLHLVLREDWSDSFFLLTIIWGLQATAAPEAHMQKNKHSMGKVVPTRQKVAVHCCVAVLSVLLYVLNWILCVCVLFSVFMIAWLLFFFLFMLV